MPVPVSSVKSSQLVESAKEPVISDESLGKKESLQPEDLSDPEVLAGYRDCLRETLRYLLQEERLPPDHPVILGLIVHLNCEQAKLDLGKMSSPIQNSLNLVQPNLSNSQPLTVTHSQPVFDDGSLKSSEEMCYYVMPNSLGYKITLVDDDDVSTDEDEMDEEDSEEVDWYVQLLRMLYQGYDLVAIPKCDQESFSVLADNSRNI